MTATEASSSGPPATVIRHFAFSRTDHHPFYLTCCLQPLAACFLWDNRGRLRLGRPECCVWNVPTEAKTRSLPNRRWTTAAHPTADRTCPPTKSRLRRSRRARASPPQVNKMPSNCVWQRCNHGALRPLAQSLVSYEHSCLAIRFVPPVVQLALCFRSPALLSRQCTCMQLWLRRTAVCDNLCEKAPVVAVVRSPAPQQGSRSPAESLRVDRARFLLLTFMCIRTARRGRGAAQDSRAERAPGKDKVEAHAFPRAGVSRRHIVTRDFFSHRRAPL